MAYSALPFPSSNALQSLGIIAVDTTIYIAPDSNGKTGSAPGWTGLTLGDDVSGDGTLSRPYATLKKAWAKAQTYIIAGNATLTVQFQKGIYNYVFDPSDTDGTNPFPKNLYHPQGSSIVIQGDVKAIKQRYIYGVKDYTFDLSRCSYYGHTGSVNTWRGWHLNGSISDPAETFANGTTAHGFTGEDVGGYVCITNAAMGAVSNAITNYRDTNNGVNTGNKYGYQHNFGRYGFNHGISYEEADAILGLARIDGATSSLYDLNLQFRNTNLDGRIFTYPGTHSGGKLTGGLGTSISYAGVASNYPEPQYSVPNGFYGPTYGINASGALVSPSASNPENAVSYGLVSSSVTIPYPSRGSVTHITDDPHLLTNYPVVIKVSVLSSASGSNRPVPFVLDGCAVRSIRNLMLVNGNVEAVDRNFKYGGLTLSPCVGFDSISTIGTLNSRDYSSNGMVLRNGSKTTLRHIGFLGWGTGNDSSRTTSTISVSGNSTLGLDDGISTEEHNSSYFSSSNGNIDYYAILGHISNTSSLMIMHGGGIQVESNSSVDLSKSYLGSSSAKSESYSDASCLIHNITNTSAITVTHKSNVSLGHTRIIPFHRVPGTYGLYFNFPYLPGISVFGGSTASFIFQNVFNNSLGRGVTYNSVIGYMNSAGTRNLFMKVTSIESAGITTSGGWINATWTGGLSPLYNQPILVRGYKINSTVYDTKEAIQTRLNAGDTLEFFAYHDAAEGATVANQYVGFGKNGIAIRVSGGSGVTYAGTTTSYGYSAAFGGVGYSPTSTTGFGAVTLYKDQGASNIGIYCNDCSSVKSCGPIIIGGGVIYTGILVSDGDSVFTISSGILIRDFTHSGVLVGNRGGVMGANNTTNTAGSLILKHPVGHGLGNSDVYDSLSSYNNGFTVRDGGIYGGRISIVGVGIPLTQYGTINEAYQKVGFWSKAVTTTPTPDFTDSSNIPINISSAEKFLTAPMTYASIVLGWDGGVMAESSVSPCNLMNISNSYMIYGLDSVSHVWNVEQGRGTPPMGIRIMTRGGYGYNAGNQFLYNAPMGATMWYKSPTLGNTGWVGHAADPGSEINALYRDNVKLNTTTPFNATLTNPQNGGSIHGTPPGYSGPAVYLGTNHVVNANILMS